MFRPSSVLVAVPLVLAAACGDKFNNSVTAIASGPTVNGAIVRFANATDTPITLTNAGVVADTNVVFGEQSVCLSVAVASTGGLVFTNVTNGTTIAFAPSFTVGGKFTVIAFSDASGAIRFATMNSEFTPTSGHAGLRMFNAVSSIPSATVLINSVPIDGAAAFGTANQFRSITSGTVNVAFENEDGTALFLDDGTITFTTGQSQTIVLGPPAPGIITFRAFLVDGC
jgi:hypothetical protein